MKRFLIFTMTLLFVPQSYAADVKLSGDIRIRATAIDNLSDANDKRDDRHTFMDSRFRIKTSASSDPVTAIVTLDISNDYNDSSGCPSDSPAGCGTGNYRMGTVAFGNTYNIVGVREAYLLLKYDGIGFALGRKTFHLGQGLLFEDTADGIATKVTTGPIETVLASLKLFEHSASTTGATEDADLYLLKFRIREGDDTAQPYGKGKSLFVAYLKDPKPSLAPFSTLATDEANLLASGVTGDLSIGPHLLNFEIDYLAGKLKNTASSDTDLSGYNLLFSADLKTLVGDVDLTALYTSGEKPTADDKTNINGISGNYVLGNILINDKISSDRDGQCASLGGNRIVFGGRSCIGGSGITALKVRYPLVNRTPTEVVLIWAQTTQPVATGASKDLGFEIDFNQKYKLAENAFIGVYLGYLVSGEAYKNIGSGSDSQISLVASLNYTF